MNEASEKLYAQYITTIDGVGEGWGYSPHRELFEDEAIEYIRADKVKEMLDQHAAEARAEQRQMCADAVTESRQHDGGITDKALRYACINALEKPDV